MLFAEITNGVGETIKLKIVNPSDVQKSYADQMVILGIRLEVIADEEGVDAKAINIEMIENKVGIVEPSGRDRFVTCVIAGK